MLNTQLASASPAWILCRNLTAIPLESDEALESWANLGRVRPDDYLVNPGLDRCVQAKDIAELRAIIRRGAIRRFAKVSFLHGWIAAAISSFISDGNAS